MACGVALGTTLTSAMARPPQPIPSEGPFLRIDPVAIAPLYLADGVIVRGEPVAYSGVLPQSLGFEPTFDQFLGQRDVPGDYPPIGGNLPPCLLAPDTRYYFGTTARSPHFLNDFSGIAPEQIGRRVDAIAVGFLHNPIEPEPLRYRVVWWNEFNSDCAGFEAGTDSVVAARGFIAGVELDFSLVPPSTIPRYAFVSLRDIALPPMPDDAGGWEGSLYIVHNPTVYSSRSQPMLWGTQRDANPPPGPFPSLPGGPGLAVQWDDDGGTTPELVDGVFTTRSPNECYNYAFALCYRPLGPMVAFFRGTGQPPLDFALVSPPHNTQSDDATPTLEWNDSGPSPLRYEVRVSLEEDLDPAVFTAVLDETTVTVPEGALQHCRTYFWGVKAIGAGGQTRSTPPWQRYTILADPRGDFNGDHQVDMFDYLDFVNAFQSEDAAADFNGDSQIDFFDYLIFIAAYDAQC
jgi:hypothetical protein